MRFVCTSDTHTKHSTLPIPDGDVFLHAGDFTRRGELSDVADFDRFLAGLPHKHKIVIAGNHDFAFEREPDKARALLKHCTYLQDGEATVEGLLFPTGANFFRNGEAADRTHLRLAYSTATVEQLGQVGPRLRRAFHRLVK